MRLPALPFPASAVLLTKEFEAQQHTAPPYCHVFSAPSQQHTLLHIPTNSCRTQSIGRSAMLCGCLPLDPCLMHTPHVQARLHVAPGS